MKRSVKWKNAPALPGSSYLPTTLEQVANCATHIPWVPVSVFGLVRLYSKADNRIEIFLAIIYGAAIVFLFLTSSAFHACSLFFHDGRLRSTLHLCDRVVIYLFIAASYTPWLVLRDFHASWGLFTLWMVWISAVFGIIFQCLFRERCKWLECLLYLAVGICPAFAVLLMHEWAGVTLLFWGGFTYVLGVVFFKMDGRIPMAHAIWHCFVSFGAYLHFCAVDNFLIVN
ncbi:unnamed protein product [Calicophoron daubneyi]